MIYRILIDSVDYLHDEATNELITPPSGTRMRGVFVAGFSAGLGDIPFPRLSNQRARFYFTEAGWKKYGRNVYAAAQRGGHVVRLIRLKNPARSQIVYQDAYQVAILPERKRQR